MLKPNKIKHTVYPDTPAQDYNDWVEEFTRYEVVRDIDEFKRKFDKLWEGFKKEVQGKS